jgi:Tfp pilus assembly protein PilF
MVDLAKLESMLREGQDSAMLRVALGNSYLRLKDAGAAALHLRRAVELDPEYSAAWKLYGRALADSGRTDEAIEAFERGIGVARNRGDMQAVREMTVFLKRLRT